MLEVIATSIDDIEIINKSKADQIEFCVDIDKDGLSPSIEMVERASIVAKKSLRIMLRMHYDSFLINKNQLNKLVEYINRKKNMNFSGYVFGALDSNNAIDDKALNLVLDNINNSNITFHKAIDKSKNILESINKVGILDKVKFILTSGGEGSPEKNMETLSKIQPSIKSKIILGGGTTLSTVKIMKKYGFNNFHIGRAARVGESYNNPISVDNINNFVQRINDHE